MSLIPSEISISSQLKNLEMHAIPFRWPEWSPLISAEVSEALVEDLPQDGFIPVERRAGSKTYSMLMRPASGKEAGSLVGHPYWQALIAELSSATYIADLGRVVGIELGELDQEITIWKYPTDGFLAPHPDHETKVFTQVVYLNREWEADWGGCLRLIGDGTNDVTVAPTLGRSVGIIRSDISLHEVTKVVSPDASERLSVQIVFSKR